MQSLHRLQSGDTRRFYRAGMATLTDWLVRLGNTGAVRNAATVCAERRAAEARADALVRRFEQTNVQTERRLTTTPAA
jgi:hypothetical protein